MKFQARYFLLAPRLKERLVHRLNDLVSDGKTIDFQGLQGLKRMGDEQLNHILAVLKQRLARAPSYGEFVTECLNMMIASLLAVDSDELAEVEDTYRVSGRAKDWISSLTDGQNENGQ